MITTITFDSGKELTLEANASTKYRYKQVFGRELNDSLFTAKKDLKAELIEELAYIMAKQAAGEAKSVSEEGFFEWLEEFEPFDFTLKGADVINLYGKQAQMHSVSKKKESQ